MERDIDVESNYIENWKQFVENPDGSINKEQIKKELADFSLMLREVPTVYMEVTGGLLSKPNYFADSVISAYNDRQERLENEAIEDYKENLDTQTLYAIREKVSGEYVKELHESEGSSIFSLADQGYLTFNFDGFEEDKDEFLNEKIEEIKGRLKEIDLEIIKLSITATPIAEGEED